MASNMLLLLLLYTLSLWYIISTTSRLYIGLAVRLYVFINFYIHMCSNCHISAGKGHIKKLTGQIA